MSDMRDLQSNGQRPSGVDNVEAPAQAETDAVAVRPDAAVPAPQPVPAPAPTQPAFGAAGPVAQSTYVASPAAPPAYHQQVTYNSYQPAPVVIAPQGTSFLVRAVWFIFIGWWLTGITIGVAYLAAITVVGLPLGFYLFNRIPTILTLRPTTQRYEPVTAHGVTVLQQRHVAQLPLLLRAVYFVLVGWWLGALWMGLAYALCVIIIGLPFGVMMFDRVGGIMTLHRH